MINRRGELGEQIMIFAFIFLIVVIGVGTVLAVSFFIGPEFDFRQIAADVLNYKISSCLKMNGLVWLGSAEFDSRKDVLYDKCNLNSSMIEQNNRIKICSGTDSIDNCIGEQDKSKILVYTSGDMSSCNADLASKNVYFPRCSVGLFEKNGIKYLVLVTDNQKIRRV
jgi:hypothetical protein